MNAHVVTDTTCLIGLERIGRLDLLPASFVTLFAPPAVGREFGTPLAWLTIQPPSNTPLVAALSLQLGAGESEAIALAQEKDLTLILDDRRARLVASRIGVRCIGTLAVLVKARRSSLLSALTPVLDDLEKNGFFISPALRAEALRLAGE